MPTVTRATIAKVAMAWWLRDHVQTRVAPPSEESLTKVMHEFKLGSQKGPWFKVVGDNYPAIALPPGIIDVIAARFFDDSKEKFEREAMAKFGQKAENAIRVKKQLDALEKQKAASLDESVNSNVVQFRLPGGKPPGGFPASPDAHRKAVQLLVQERGVNNPENVENVAAEIRFETLEEANSVIAVARAYEAAVKGDLWKRAEPDAAAPPARQDEEDTAEPDPDALKKPKS